MDINNNMTLREIEMTIKLSLILRGTRKELAKELATRKLNGRPYKALLKSIRKYNINWNK